MACLLEGEYLGSAMWEGFVQARSQTCNLNGFPMISRHAYLEKSWKHYVSHTPCVRNCTRERLSWYVLMPAHHTSGLYLEHIPSKVSQRSRLVPCGPVASKPTPVERGAGALIVRTHQYTKTRRRVEIGFIMFHSHVANRFGAKSNVWFLCSCLGY